MTREGVVSTARGLITKDAQHDPMINANTTLTPLGAIDADISAADCPLSPESSINFCHQRIEAANLRCKEFDGERKEPIMTGSTW